MAEKWVPLAQVKGLMCDEVAVVDAILKCRRRAQVIRNPDADHKGMWVCARVPVPKGVLKAASSVRAAELIEAEK